MMLKYYGHETFGWSQLYANYVVFLTTYQMLGVDTPVVNFHLQEGLICHLGHLCIPLRECAKLIWEAHYNRVAGQFGVDKTVAVLQKYFYWSKLQ